MPAPADRDENVGVFGGEGEALVRLIGGVAVDVHVDGFTVSPGAKVTEPSLSTKSDGAVAVPLSVWYGTVTEKGKAC